MKRNLLLLVIIISYFGSLSQESDNFYTIKTNLDMYFDSVINIYGLENMQGRDYNPYMRWVDYWQPILYPHGDFVIERQQHEQYISEFISGNITYSYTPFELEWNLIGPNSMPEGTQRWAKGLGQIHYIAFDPNDTLYLKMFACSPVGGLWKSFDGGENWINAGTDKGLPRCGVSSIAFDPDNSETNWFISTGNAESMPGRFLWQNSIGVARTTDGGGSWEIIGLTNVLRMRKLISTKYQGNVVLLVATTNGVYVCMDALSAQPQFVKLIDGDFYDVEFDPISFGTAYASGTGLNTSVYSLDWINSTHEELQNLEMIPSHEGRRLIIDISPAAPENLFIVATYWGGPNTSYLYRYNLPSSTLISKGMLPKADLNEPGVGPE